MSSVGSSKGCADNRRNVKFESAVPVISSVISNHKTYMDTRGRTALTLTAMNVIDESRDKDLIVSLSGFNRHADHQGHLRLSHVRWSAKTSDHLRRHVRNVHNHLGCWKPGYEDRKQGRLRARQPEGKATRERGSVKLLLTRYCTTSA